MTPLIDIFFHGFPRFLVLGSDFRQGRLIVPRVSEIRALVRAERPEPYRGPDRMLTDAEAARFADMLGRLDDVLDSFNRSRVTPLLMSGPGERTPARLPVSAIRAQFPDVSDEEVAAAVAEVAAADPDVRLRLLDDTILIEEA